MAITSTPKMSTSHSILSQNIVYCAKISIPILSIVPKRLQILPNWNGSKVSSSEVDPVEKGCSNKIGGVTSPESVPSHTVNP